MGRLNPNITEIGISAFIGVITTGVVDLPNLTGTVNWFNYNYRDVKLIEGIENLGQATSIAAFMHHTKMKFAKLPATTTEIKVECFSGCTSLETVICYATNPPSLASYVFNNTPIASGTGFIYVPDASVDTYKAATNWSQYQARIKPLSEYVEE
jgi:hypothetical protein